MKYDNTSYWIEMHKKYKDSLKGVGISLLSDKYNDMKYSSESDTMLKVLDSIKSEIESRVEVSVLDVGAGNGFWTQLIHGYLSKMSLKLRVFALDISEDALEVIKHKIPEVNIVQADLKTIDINRFGEIFDIVSAIYCLHHIISLQDYVNSIKFVGKSVKRGGFLLIGDPILRKSFSKFYQTDFYTYEGHSFPRPLYIIDSILIDEGFERIAIQNFTSFLLGANMESSSKIGFYIQRKIWNVGFFIFFRSNSLSKFFNPCVKFFDSLLKKTKVSNSSILVLYRRRF